MHIKIIKNTNSTKRQTGDFFLKCFYTHKNAAFFVLHIKITQKTHGKHKDANKRISDIFPFRCFLFFSLMCVLALLVRVRYFHKKIKLP